jgi:hypothetical protein
MSHLYGDDSRMTTASLQLALELRDEGIATAVASRSELVALLRAELQQIAARRQSKLATADDVHEVLVALKMRHSDLGNAAGALFRDGNWLFTGEWKQSMRSPNHARAIRVWQLKQQSNSSTNHGKV